MPCPGVSPQGYDQQMTTNGNGSHCMPSSAGFDALDSVVILGNQATVDKLKKGDAKFGMDIDLIVGKDSSLAQTDSSWTEAETAVSHQCCQPWQCRLDCRAPSILVLKANKQIRRLKRLPHILTSRTGNQDSLCAYAQRLLMSKSKDDMCLLNTPIPR